MRHHKSIMLSAIAASFIVAHGGGGLYAQDISSDTKLTQNKDNKSHSPMNLAQVMLLKQNLAKPNFQVKIQSNILL
ncbi:hypothetical protein NAL62_000101 [Campylobacter jejuni]|nr:hypothetical protein [Campylobacter jejuni]